MPMSKTRRGRLKQVENWLRDKFPTPYKTLVRVEAAPQFGKGHYYGVTWRRDDGIVLISISNKLTWTPAQEVLIHEWAHAMTWRPDHIERLRDHAHHDTEWAIAYGKIYQRFHDGKGGIESREYPSKV